MNSEYDITLHSDEKSSPGMARERFLDSLGLGEIPPAAPEMTDSAKVEDSVDESGDEGVVLSSQPDDLDPPAVDSESGQRTLSYSLGSSSERTRTVAISITPKDRIVGPAAEAAGPIPDKTTNLDENLTLACPECHGELVLQRRHLGIEGLCVWCHTPIIAAESVRDSIVRVFPVLGRITKPFTAPAAEPAIAEAKEEVAETVVEVEAPAPAPEVGPEAVAPVETAAPAPAEEVEATVPEPASFSPEAFGFGPPPVTTPVSMTSLSPAPPAPADATAASADFSHVKEEVSPFDLDALYATSSFRESDEEDDLPSAGFGETIADSTLAGSPDTEVPGTGFGAFLQSTPPATPAPAAAPLAESWSTPAAAATAAAHEAAGFSAATPWGPPSKPAVDTTAPLPLAFSAAPTAANDDAPVSLPTDFASGFGSPAPASAPTGLPAAIEGTGSVDAPWATAFEEAAPADATTAPSPVDDFAAAFPTGGFGNLTAPSDLGSFTAPGEPNPTLPAAPLSNDFAAGFQATGFGAPAPTPAAIPVAANEPALASPATPVDDFAAAFASAGFGSPAATPAPVESMKSATGFSSFPETAPAPAAASLPVVETAETPEFTFQTSPASKLLFGDDGADEKRSFAMPGHGFSTGSSSESESKPPLFPDVPATGAPATGWGISEPIGFSSPDDAPVPLSSGPAFVPGTGMSQVPSPEESPSPPLTGSSSPVSIETPVSLFSEAAPAMVSTTPAPMPPTMPTPENVSAAPAAPAAPKSIPLLPQTQEPTFSSIANPIEASAPNVVSEPLGSKPKPKVRKGFIVLMVVIVGFAAGAALASFVLPIDEYVQTARALMEQKFNSGSSVQQFPVMPLTAGEAVNPAVPPVEP